jgi:uncharacterized membrane protein YbhN (UPF0104 family)
VASWKLPGILIPEGVRTAQRVLSRPWARITLTAVFLAAALLLFPRHRVLNAVANMDPAIVAAALPAYLAIQALAAWKWYLLVSRSGAGLGFWQAFECCFAGMFGTLFLPSALGADAVAITLGMARAKSRAGIASGAFLSRVLDVVAMAMLVTVFAAFVPQGLRGDGARLAKVVWAGGIVALAATAASAMLLFSRWRPAAVGRIFERHRAAFEPMRRPLLAVFPLLMSLFTQMSFAMLSYLIGRACGVKVGVGVWLFTWTLAKLVILLPFTVAGIGARELALAALLTPFGVPTTTAVATGLVWDVVVVIGSLSAGAVWKLLAWRNGRV